MLTGRELSTVSTNRIPSLDGLRTMSIILVIVSHVCFLLHFSGAYNVGDLGVRVFFVISGFLITGLLVKECDKTGSINLLRFYFRRTLRIFPAYYFFLIIFVLLAVFGKADISARQFLPVFTYTSNYIFPGNWNLDHAWSLSVEEQFYLIYPGFLLLFGRRRMEWLLAATLVVCPILRFVDHRLFIDIHPIWMTKGFHANLDTLAIGCLLALKHRALHEIGWYRRLLDSRWMYLTPLLLIVVNGQIDYTGQDLGLLFSVNNILIAVVIDWAVTHHASVAGRVLNSRPFVFVGMMSYSIYLWQQPFLLDLGAVIDRFVHAENSDTHFSFPYGLVGFIGFCCLSYFVIERFSLRLRQKYEPALFDRPQKTLSTETAEG